ncbi:Hypothetical predicted protein, partial [Mytilus galloprovincialis]
ALELEVATSATVALSVTRTNRSSFRFNSTHKIEQPVKVNESIEINTTQQPGTSNKTSTTLLSLKTPTGQDECRSGYTTPGKFFKGAADC